MDVYKKPSYRIELDVYEPSKMISLPCGIRLPAFIILEDIWQQTGCDIPREKGKWFCNHCNQCYFFYLF